MIHIIKLHVRRRSGAPPPDMQAARRCFSAEGEPLCALLPCVPYSVPPWNPMLHTQRPM